MTTIKESLKRIGQENDHIKVVPKSTNMETLNTVIELILINYKVNFIIEQVEFNGTTTMYRLKKRTDAPFLFSLGKNKTIDEYVVNELGYTINFPTLESIEIYLRLSYSEPEGFKTNTFDLK